MKKYKIVLAILLINIFAYNKANSQITDTLQWLRVNIEQKSSYFVGKPLSVLLDSIRFHGVYANINWETSCLDFSDDQPANTLPMNTAWKKSFKIYFGQVYGSGGAWGKHEANPNINTHLRWIILTFTQKIPFPTKITADQHLGTLFGPVEPICRPYIVASIQVGEY